MLKYIIQLGLLVFTFTAVSTYQELGMLKENGKTSAPFFSLPKLDDPQQRIDLTSIKGKQTVVYFFAPWCSICKYSMPNLDKLYKNNELNAIAIALDYPDIQSVHQFSEALSLSMPILLGDSTTAQNFKVKAYPTYYVIDENLKVVERSVGYSSELGIKIRL
ncbi:TlpA family protein disulfide reductase [Pseudoalteromonas sp. MMG005]|nr:TlpA family protein disulfide reductase [Pseudoalteromonas sp. MMG005]